MADLPCLHESVPLILVHSIPSLSVKIASLGSDAFRECNIKSYDLLPHSPEIIYAAATFFIQLGCTYKKILCADFTRFPSHHIQNFSSENHCHASLFLPLPKASGLHAVPANPRFQDARANRFSLTSVRPFR